MKTGIAIILALAATAGCRSSTGPGTAGVVGTWDWIGSTGGIAGFSYTPASVHYTVKFKFQDGKVYVFRNDSLKSTATVSVDDTVTYEPPINVFTFGGQMDRHILRLLAGDTISLADPCCDRYDHHFVRAR